MSILEDKTVLITGGTGSFGQTFARHVLCHHRPRKVIIFSRDECKQWEMQQGDRLLASPCMRYFLGDVRDGPRLRRAFEGVDFVIHAAALKQVVAAEYNPSECVKTNVLGAMNVIEAAIDAGVKRVVALSTDKAVNPVNLYGATKLCADKLFVAGNAYVGTRGYPLFDVVRYGNVLGSRGSVISHWRRLLAEGAQSLPITNPTMTRFWITVEEAVRFVIKTLDWMRGGEIFVPKCPSMRIVDLAEALAPGVAHQVQGIRPGEKIHEVLIGPEDSARTSDQGTHYRICHQLATASSPVDPAFCYASHTNSEWLDAAALRRLCQAPS